MTDKPYIIGKDLHRARSTSALRGPRSSLPVWKWADRR
jgi:hypothetical protein